MAHKTAYKVPKQAGFKRFLANFLKELSLYLVVNALYFGN